MIESTQRVINADKSIRQATQKSTDSALLKDILVKCTRCRALHYARDWKKDFKVCQRCGYHFRLSASERIDSLLDAGSFVEADAKMKSGDPLHFVNQSHTYQEKLTEEEKRTGLNEAVVSGTGRIAGHALALAVMDFHFIGGSMGSVVGEKVTRAIELAQGKRIPLLVVSASGGARMHEGILSLMQMAKVSVALTHLSEAHIPFISLLTDPTTGGVAASFAMQGDVILAEPGALVGFAGPRVIEQFIHQKLPEDADTSEFMLEHGMIDAIVSRPLLRPTLSHLLDYYTVHLQENAQQENVQQEGGEQFLWVRNEQKLNNAPDPQLHPYLPDSAKTQTVAVAVEPDEQASSLSPWDHVQLARHKDRPCTGDYISSICTSFFELRGDRRYADDPAIIEDSGFPPQRHSPCVMLL
jgi:acetyl-CoA carboxylase carboxyl transferase beta subunit